jgi:hypothetical protein
LIRLLSIKSRRSTILEVRDNDIIEQLKLAMTKVVRYILQSLKHFSNPFDTGWLVEMYCPDRYVQFCWPVLTSWIANHPKHYNYQVIKVIYVLHVLLIDTKLVNIVLKHCSETLRNTDTSSKNISKVKITNMLLQAHKLKLDPKPET